jgi:septal ring factor EnvC (AmiA/AmiB activator)
MRHKKPVADCPVSRKNLFPTRRKVYGVFYALTPCFLHIATEAVGGLRKELEAGKRVLTRSQEEKNELKEENRWKAEEIESLKTQLAQALEENQKLKGGIFGKH